MLQSRLHGSLKSELVILQCRKLKWRISAVMANSHLMALDITTIVKTFIFLAGTFALFFIYSSKTSRRRVPDGARLPRGPQGTLYLSYAYHIFETRIGFHRRFN